MHWQNLYPKKILGMIRLVHEIVISIDGKYKHKGIAIGSIIMLCGENFALKVT